MQTYDLTKSEPADHLAQAVDELRHTMEDLIIVLLGGLS